MQSHFAPGYAYQTGYAYPQYSGNITYPGPSIMATTSGPLALGLGSLATLITWILGWMWLTKNTKFNWFFKLIFVLMGGGAMGWIFQYAGTKIQGI